MQPKIDNSFSRSAKIALIKRDLSVTELSNQLERPRPTVSAVVNGSRRFPRVRKLVAKHLNLAA